MSNEAGNTTSSTTAIPRRDTDSSNMPDDEDEYDPTEPMIEEIDAEDGKMTSSAAGNVLSSVVDRTAAQHLQIGDLYTLNEQYDLAIDAYACAEAQENNCWMTRFRIHSHRAKAFYQLQRYPDSYDDAIIATKLLMDSFTTSTATTTSSSGPSSGLLRGESEACWKRYGMACYQLGKCNDAILGFEKALQLSQLNNTSTSIVTSHKEWIEKCRAAMNPASSTAAAASSMKTESAAAAASINDTTTTTTKPTGTYVVPKYRYSQTDKFMTIEILGSNLTSDKLKVDIGTDYITVTVQNGITDYGIICGTLYDEIVVGECKTVYKAEKVLLKLRKSKSQEWHELLKRASSIGGKKSKIPKKQTKANAAVADIDNATDATTSTNTTDAMDASEVVDTKSSTTKIPGPYASHRDWNSIEKDIENELEQEKPAGDDAMNVLFQQIFKDADPDTRKAMIKSYQTSGGTVLSTNWKEVKEKDYEAERTAPKGVEWKTWEGKKLPMKDDD